MQKQSEGRWSRARDSIHQHGARRQEPVSRAAAGAADGGQRKEKRGEDGTGEMEGRSTGTQEQQGRAGAEPRAQTQLSCLLLGCCRGTRAAPRFSVWTGRNLACGEGRFVGVCGMPAL